MDETTKRAILTLVANFSDFIRQHCAQMEEVKRERDALRDHVETLLAQAGNATPPYPSAQAFKRAEGEADASRREDQLLRQFESLHGDLDQQSAMMAAANEELEKSIEERKAMEERAVAAETALMNILKHASREADELIVEWTVKATGEWDREDALADFCAGWAVIDKLAGPRPHHPRDY